MVELMTLYGLIWFEVCGLKGCNTTYLDVPKLFENKTVCEEFMDERRDRIYDFLDKMHEEGKSNYNSSHYDIGFYCSSMDDIIESHDRVKELRIRKKSI